MYFVEWCQGVNHRKGNMIPLKQLSVYLKSRDPGYASLYWFDASTAKEVRLSGSSAGLNRYPVTAESVTIDLDDGEASVERLKSVLADLGIGFELYTSGGKGYHFLIKHQRVTGVNVPYSHRKWVESLRVACDLSLYQAGRICSLPGRIHPKTKRPKALVEVVPGRELELPLVDLPVTQFNLPTVDEGTLEHGLWRLLALISSEPTPGNRHTTLWSTACTLRDAGLEHSTILDLLQGVNKLWQNQKDPVEVETAVSQAMKRGNVLPSEGP